MNGCFLLWFQSYEHEKKWADFVQRHNGLDALDDRINSKDPLKADTGARAALAQEFRVRAMDASIFVSRSSKKIGIIDHNLLCVFCLHGCRHWC